MADLTDENEQKLVEIRKDIEKLLQMYHDIVTPGQILTDWVILTQRNSIELEQSQQRAFGIMAAEGQSFITTRGLLETGIDIERANFLQGVFNS